MLGERLAYLRKKENISQKELGEKLNISHYTISSYEKGRSEPNDEIKVRIARYFNVTLDYLVGLIEKPLPFDRETRALYLPPSMDLPVQKAFQDFFAFWEERDQAGKPAEEG